MPLWKINHGPGIFTDAKEKQAVAQAVTDYYTAAGLPDYYVTVKFSLQATEDFYTAGKPDGELVFVEIIHAARNVDPMKEPERVKRMKDGFDKILLPYTKPRNFHLEYVVINGPTGMWRIDGVDPPESFAPDEQDKAAASKKRLEEYRTNGFGIK